MIVAFSLSALWWRIRGFWKLPDGIDRLRGILGLVLMDGALLSKSLIQFSVDGWSCVPSLLFTWGQSRMEVMKIMVTSQKGFHAYTATVHAPNPAAGHHWPTPLSETHGHPQARLLWGHCSFLLGPDAQGSVCALQESFPQSYVSLGSSMVGLMVTSSKTTYAIPTPRAPVPGRPLPTCTFTGDSQTWFCLSLCGVFGSWCEQGLFEPSKHLGQE